MAKGLDTRHHPGRQVGRDRYIPTGVTLPVSGQRRYADEEPELEYGHGLTFGGGGTPFELMDHDSGTWTKDEYEAWEKG